MSLSNNKPIPAVIGGGGDGGVIRECLSKDFESLDWYELDPEVITSCKKYLPDVFKNVDEDKKVHCQWGDAFESIKTVPDKKYDKLFVDLNDDDTCIDLAQNNMVQLKRILKPGGIIITVQVGSVDENASQVLKWTKLLESNFGNAKVKSVFILNFDCRWTFILSKL